MAKTKMIVGGGHPEFVEHLKKKRELVVRLADTIREFLVFDIDDSLKQIEKHLELQAKNAAEDRASLPERLIEASQRRDIAAAQLENLDKAIESGELPEVQKNLLRVSRSSFEQGLKNVEQEIEWIQGEMEDGEDTGLFDIGAASGEGGDAGGGGNRQG